MTTLITTSGKTVIVSCSNGSTVDFTARTTALAADVAAILSGALADAYNTGRVEEAEDRRQSHGRNVL